VNDLPSLLRRRRLSTSCPGSTPSPAGPVTIYVTWSVTCPAAASVAGAARPTLVPVDASSLSGSHCQCHGRRLAGVFVRAAQFWSCLNQRWCVCARAAEWPVAPPQRPLVGT
jgi:hypothetical protein